MTKQKTQQKTKQKQPNFLFLITDQQRSDWLGCYGHPVLKTPNIDGLAAQGTRFENFHVAMPICMPNRASLLTGRYPSVHGLRHNGCLLPQSARTFVDVLAEAGYDTAAIGKSHLQPFTGQPPVGRVPRDDIEGEAWWADERDYQQEEPGRYADPERYDFQTPYYGYRHVDMVTSHGDRCGGHYGQWFREQAPDWKALHDNANELKHNYSCPQAYRTPVPEELYPTAYIRDRAVDYISNRDDEDAPFFAFVSFPDPHHPFNPPGRYWDMYDPDQFPVDLPYEAHKNPIPPMQWLHEHMGGGQLTPQMAMMVQNRQLQEAMALTAGMMGFIDDAVGDILTALDQSGQRDNTVVVYNSDHGDYLGDFNMLLKGGMPFRSITQVPFIWSEPGQSGAAVNDAMASTIDIGPTILARAGLKPFNGVQGTSLMPVIEDKDDVRDDLLIECTDASARYGFDAPARVRSVVSKKWRYSFYAGQDWGELYNLEDDPHECNNLWDDPASFKVRAELSERLNFHLTRQMDDSPAAQRVA